MVGLTPPNPICTPSAGTGMGGYSHEGSAGIGVNVNLDNVATFGFNTSLGYTSPTTGLVVIAMLVGAVLYFSMLS